jgi:hypothetical protein
LSGLSGLWPWDTFAATAPGCPAVWAALLVPPLGQPGGGSHRVRRALGAAFAALLACCPAGKPFQGPRPAGRLPEHEKLLPVVAQAAVVCRRMPPFGFDVRRKDNASRMSELLSDASKSAAFS